MPDWRSQVRLGKLVEPCDGVRRLGVRGLRGRLRRPRSPRFLILSPAPPGGKGQHEPIKSVRIYARL